MSGAEIVDPARALAILKEQSQFPDLADALPDNPLPYTIVEGSREQRLRIASNIVDVLLDGRRADLL